ncbi:MAG: 5'-methylthioadenosine/adenosylhomocysteine nucleosidase [Oscillospiraceae bacterium]|nr:5'-methylthioadenosine/adenosylhomocysteine nucleosidase [Oscillospiraceae bacterium]
MEILGIIGAMAVEVEALKNKMKGLTVSEYAGMTFYEGNLSGQQAVVVECGIGKVNSALCVQVLCDRFGVKGIVNTGIAGSLCNDLDIGDLVISTDAMYHDFTCQDLHPDYAVGQIPGFPVLSFPADEGLQRLACQAARTVQEGAVQQGRIASGDQFVGDRVRKEKIVADTGALCTEMEGAAIAHAAWRNQVPFVIIRAISDKADNSAEMDYPSFEALAAARCAAVTEKLAQILAGA